MHPVIFISYAWNDNELLKGNKDSGWVENLYIYLKHELKPRYPKLYFWKDDRDIKKSSFTVDEEIEQVLRDSDVLVSVVSPQYLESDYCESEVKFFSRIRKDGQTANLEKIVRINKTPIRNENDLSPDKNNKKDRKRNFSALYMRGGHDFFALEKRQGNEKNEIPFFAFGGIKEEEKYWDVITDIMNEIRTIVDPPDHSQRNGAGNKAVFIAQAGRDVLDKRRKVVGEIDSHDVNIISADAVPGSKKKAVSFLDAALAKSDFSVHLIGKTAGPKLGTSPPLLMTELQLERAAERYKKNDGFRRLIWIDPELGKGKNEGNRIATGLISGKTSKLPDEVIEEPFEQFKTFVIDQLGV